MRASTGPCPMELSLAMVRDGRIDYREDYSRHRSLNRLGLWAWKPEPGARVIAGETTASFDRRHDYQP